MAAEPKGRKDAFAAFFEEPSRVTLRDLLSQHEGELKNYDFKGEWPPNYELARHILGFANSGGGCLVIGVAEQEDGTLDAVGLQSLEDKKDIVQSIQKYLPQRLHELVSIFDYAYKDTEYTTIKGKKFQVLLVPDAPDYVPFVATADGGPDGKRPRKAAIYVRRGASTEEANYEEVQGVLNRRLETQRSTSEEFTLEGHLAELKSLYKQISAYTFVSPPHRLIETFSGMVRADNPNYPKEPYDEFVAKLIDRKKRQIERFVDERLG